MAGMRDEPRVWQWFTFITFVKEGEIKGRATCGYPTTTAVGETTFSPLGNFFLSQVPCIPIPAFVHKLFWPQKNGHHSFLDESVYVTTVKNNKN